ncbi:MAG: RluA family pseudouridine synthase [Planctomycetes bacterium]|nr:RluA family pseudouridine synthase [Planctomycetota bacterium]
MTAGEREEVVSFRVPDGTAEGRLDRVLAARFPDRTRSQLQRLIRDGRVTVGGLPPTKTGQVVRAGDEIRVSFAPVTVPATVTAEEIPLRILYEDEHLAVIDKPAGMLTHPAPGRSSGTLVNAILYYFEEVSDYHDDQARPGIVHRLDRETSGVLIVVKNAAAHAELARQFHDREVKKEYLAVVAGVIVEESRAIDAPIGRHPSYRERGAVDPVRGRPALTRFEVVERFAHHTLLRAFPESGRRHQIRLHLAWLKHPVVGDQVYGGRAARLTFGHLGVTAPARRDLPVIARHALHARRIAFRHPISGTPLAFEAQVPGDFAALLATLRELTSGS